MISVLMTTYHEPEHILRQAIESILNQTYRDIEYIIVADDPDNRTHHDVISEYADRDARIIPVFNEVNLQQSRSLNKALGFAHGEYIARMDADDISLPDRLEKQLAYLQKNNLDLVGGILNVIAADGTPVYRIRSVPEKQSLIRFGLGFGMCLAHPSWLGRKAMFDDLGGYRIDVSAQDYDFLLRAALHGYKLGNVNIPVLQYRLSPDSVSRLNLYRQYLTMLYLSNQYRQGKEADFRELEAYTGRRFSSKKAAAYVHAEEIFYGSLHKVTERKYLSAFLHLAEIPFVSPAYVNKIFRFAVLCLLALPKEKQS